MAQKHSKASCTTQSTECFIIELCPAMCLEGLNKTTKDSLDHLYLVRIRNQNARNTKHSVTQCTATLGKIFRQALSQSLH
jgi:hypothetical protein